ncbi:hypothetical protein L1887_02355 [Cichorium endivia]|nr:hypothetical protein L1887_02355 [Cichorium endivia]
MKHCRQSTSSCCRSYFPADFLHRRLCFLLTSPSTSTAHVPVACCCLFRLSFSLLLLLPACDGKLKMPGLVLDEIHEDKVVDEMPDDGSLSKPKDNLESSKSPDASTGKSATEVVEPSIE